MKPMVVAVASGKGGTGKTTVAVNLARVIAQNGDPVRYLDCDVEEPNGHIFLQPRIETTQPVNVMVPVLDPTKCNACGLCRDICEYGAIALMGRKLLIFPNLCRSCGGCVRVCPTGALPEGHRPVGVIETGSVDGIGFVHGRMNIGEAMAPTIIRRVKDHILPEGVSIIDAPPGTSCPVIQSVRGADFVLLVTEPTPFGLHDLTLAVEMLKELKLPFGVIVNRAGSGDDRVNTYCRDEGVEIIAEIPDDRRVAEAYSRGLLAVDAVPGYAEVFDELRSSILERCESQKPIGGTAGRA